MIVAQVVIEDQAATTEEEVQTILMNLMIHHRLKNHQK
jgi:hypothetical protein